MSTKLTDVELQGGSIVDMALPSSDNSSAIPNTAWVKALLATFGAGSGSVTLPGGFTIKYGTVGGLPDTTAVTVSPMPGGNFPTAMIGAIAIDMAHVGGNNRPMGTDSYSVGSFQMSAQGSGASAFWVAFGY